MLRDGKDEFGDTGGNVGEIGSSLFSCDLFYMYLRSVLLWSRIRLDGWLGRFVLIDRLVMTYPRVVTTLSRPEMFTDYVYFSSHCLYR